ncbi:TlpA disulfide reductase family protein [Virgibacillus halodenitrificans]|uniref:TlpA disulfide reductase family protein n=1 Tax=Virgibacillus halodenitrificans TaxID=1482 RepID=UPI0002F0B2B4|nr:TlpA disulfide reductase family protein [Virgibacillus halodenitrificans]
MKKIIIGVIITAMFAWAVFDLVSNQSDDSTKTENEEFTSTDSGNSITSPPKEENQEKEEPADSNAVGLEVGNIAPDFELNTLNGEVVKLSDFRGQRVMLNFWATWCPPCRAEMPDMEKFHKNKDVKILAVNLTETESSRQAIEDFIKEFGVSFTVPLDEKTNVADQYQIQPIPTSYMIDSNGRIQFKALGAMNYEFMVQEFEKTQ